MATDATGTPTSLGIPKYNTSVDAPSGLGFNAAMDSIDTLLAARVTKPAAIVSGEIPVWNGTTWVRSSVTGLSPGGIAPGTAGQYLATVAGVPAWKTKGIWAYVAGAPTGTVSTAMVMLGMAGSFVPQASGNMLLMFTGSSANTVAGNGITAQLAFGTGAAPVNGAAATGTALGTAPRMLFVNANQPAGFAHTYIATGLTVGTTYWLDMQFAAISAGSATLAQCNLVAVEL